MRAWFLGAIVLAANPVPVIACTCAGTQSMGVALMSAESVVVGQVKARAAPSYSSEQPRPEAIVVEVKESLKGSLTGDIEIAEVLMCYQSFSGEEFKVGTSYVFPLIEIDLTNPNDTFGLMIGSPASNAPSYKMFILPTCSHTALLLSRGKLYTNELTSDGGRRLEYYMRLSVLKLMFRAGLFEVRRLIAGTAVLIALLAFVLVRRRRAKVRGV